jgi:zinc metalloprotease ZmpA
MRRTAAVGAVALVAGTLATGTSAAQASSPPQEGSAAHASSVAHATSATPDQAREKFTRQLAVKGSRARSAIAAVEAHPHIANVGSHEGFTVKDALVDPDGTTHVRLVRTYRGLPVLGGDLVVHRTANGAWKGVSQTLQRAPKLSATPEVTKAAASSSALAPSAVTRAISRAQVKSSQLVVDASSGKPRLAWKVVTNGVQTDGTPSRLATYVNARTDKVIRTDQLVETADGSGQSLYGGTVPLQLTQSGSTFSLDDPTRGNTYTTDFNNATDSVLCQELGMGCTTGTTFTGPDNLFGNGSTTSRESAAVDAQYGTNETWDYYKSVHGRTGIAGDGEGSYNRVHYGSNYVNAFWQDSCFCMTYGDGDGANYGPLTSLDVAGHEMTHGVTASTAGLDYSGESGGLNESTSDIFGTAVEFYAANATEKGNYLIGEAFSKNGTPLRRMDNPASDGSSANCWSSNVGNLDVHYSSGVGNHLFYLLSEGSGAKTINGVSYNSPTCNGSTVTGIGRDAAANIWYRALTVYMTSSTDYHGARTATLSAATDLYGAGSTQYNAVNTAWAAVTVS